MNNQAPQSLLSAQSMTGSFNSAAGNVSNVSGYSIQVVWSAGSTPVGTFKLQASNDGSNWSDISGATASVSGNTGNAMFNVSDAYYTFVRLVYTLTSGTATASATLFSKI